MIFAHIYLKVFHHLLVLVVHDMNVTIVKSAQHPWLRGMQIYRLHAV